MLRHLAPVIIPETVGRPAAPNAAFRIVEELIAAIKDQNVKNVAVSADYGAGKSSVVETAKAKITEEEDIRWWRFCRKKRQTKFLTISLAQLNTNGRISKKSKKDSGADEKIKERDEDIEYSLLQQLLYYDLPSKTPKSRFYRLGRIGIWRPLIWAVAILLAVFSCLILFEPEQLKVASFCERFAVSSERKFWIDLTAASLLAFLFVLFCIWLVRRNRIKIGKVKVNDAEVEVNNLSVFNQYLDEIIYFFASTRYNVVIFEDLDRFADTTRIFGKLRELNKILNSSQYLKRIIKREITFVYSVRDDLFDATCRVKFFDYIVPVIPVVNSSTAYDKLSEYLDEEDKIEFDGKDLLNLCEFFEDLRLIINIVNEYDLYKKVIRLKDFKLSRKKLFGLIVYKNYCPHDFVHLHNKRGVLASILDNKQEITNAVVAARERRIEKEIEELHNLQTEAETWESDLRREYIEVSKNQTDAFSALFDGFELSNGTRVSFDRVAENPVFFEEMENDRICFYGKGRTYPIHRFAEWQKAVNNKSYRERLKLNPYTKAVVAQKDIAGSLKSLKFSSGDTFSTIIQEEISVLNQFIDKSPKGNRLKIPEGQHQLLRFLLMHDFLDEHYLDYITYFYQNSISVEDKRFVLNITSLDKDSLPYTYPLQNPVSVADRFEPSDFETNVRLLNVDLALSLTREGDEQKVNRNALQRLAMRNRAVDFVLAVYENRNEEYVNSFLSELLTFWDFGELIHSLESQDDSRLPKLREMNIRYANLGDPNMFNAGFLTWLNGHFGFLASIFETVGDERMRTFLDVYRPKFSKISLSIVTPEFARFVIDRGYYSINSSNLENIASFLRILEDYKKASFTTFHNCSNSSLSSALKQNPQEFIRSFPLSSVEEEQWAKTTIASDERIASVTKRDYLRRQTNRISDAWNLKDTVLGWAFSNSLIAPTWENIYYLCFEKQHSAPLDFLKFNNLEGFLQLKSEKQNAVIKQWVFSNDLSYGVYAKVVSSMYGFKKLGFGADIRRIDVLISKRLLLFNAENYAGIRESYPPLAPKFLSLNINTYLGDVSSFAVSSLEMMEVLRSRGSYGKQAEYIAMRPKFEGKVSSDLADSICGLIQGRYLRAEDIEEELLLQSIKYSLHEEARLFVARKALFELPYAPEKCRAILISMRGDYARICEPGKYSWLPWNTNNNRVAKYLYENSFIDEFKRYEGKIMILKKQHIAIPESKSVSY